MMGPSMRLSLPALLALLFVWASAPAVAGTPADLSGSWVITASLAEGPVSTGLELTRTAEGYTGRSGALDILAFRPLEYSGEMVGGQLRLRARTNGVDIGSIEMSLQDGALVGKGRLYGTDVGIAARRPIAPPSAPRTLDYDPKEYHPLTSADPAPVLRLFPGDTVRTRTVDTSGQDEKGVQASMPGNPGTGPFYVEGALPGDTVSIEIIRVRTNRETARMNTQLDIRSVLSGYTQAPGAITDPTWMLDAASGSASLRAPSPKLKNFKVPLRPMLGVIAVALPGGFGIPNRDLGEWGGNMDYSELRDGATVYLPVYQAGAMIFVGDGHAVQGDGEVTGQGLETSLSVEFKVGLIKGRVLSQPWAENASHVMVSGIGGSLDDAMRRATVGMATWLKATYALDDSEVAAVLGTSLEYDIAEVVDPKLHVVAKVRKDVLSLIPRPVK